MAFVIAWTGLAAPAYADNPHVKSGARDVADKVEAPAPQASSSDTVVHAKSELSAYTDTDHVSVLSPGVAASIDTPASGWSANGSYLLDIVSAASVDIVSTASNHWTETRHAAALGGGYKPGTVGASVNGSVSREPDYLSLSGGGTLTFELADKSVNPSIGYSYAHDTAGRSTTPFSVFSQVLQRHTITGNLELIIDRETLLSFGVNGMFELGDQKKPYRFLPVFRADRVGQVGPGESIDSVNALREPGRMEERTPLKRNRLAVSARLAQRLEGSTFILNERLYADDWGLKASTTDVRFVIDLSRTVFLWTHLRAHIQSGVSFWKLAYTGSFAGTAPISVPELRTGDREMGPLVGGTFGAGLRWNFGSGARSESWSLVTEGDFLVTHYSDALFITNREGVLGTVALEASF